MKNYETQEPKFDINRNISSLKLRTDIIIRDSSLIDEAFASREIFWDTQKENIDKIMNSLRSDAIDLRRGFSENIILSEKIISDFRNKAKSDRVDLLKRHLESWKLEEFVTQKRFSQLISKELNNSEKK